MNERKTLLNMFLVVDMWGFKNLDFQKILALSDKGFRIYYTAQMRTYEVWKNGGIFQCDECKDAIEKPEDLRRYYGISLHGLCFRERRKREAETPWQRSESPQWRAYWERVANL